MNKKLYQLKGLSQALGVLEGIRLTNQHTDYHMFQDMKNALGTIAEELNYELDPPQEKPQPNVPKEETKFVFTHNITGEKKTFTNDNEALHFLMTNNQNKEWS